MICQPSPPPSAPAPGTSCASSASAALSDSSHRCSCSLNQTKVPKSMETTPSAESPVLSESKKSSFSHACALDWSQISRDAQGIPVPKTFTELVLLIRHELGPDSGLMDLNQEKVNRLQTMIANYDSKKEEWERFAFYDKYRYTRNLIDDGNGRYNLLLLCWGPGKSSISLCDSEMILNCAIGHQSPIHDHANAHCILKVMDGTIRENRYDWPENAKPLHEQQQQQAETTSNRTECAKAAAGYQDVLLPKECNSQPASSSSSADDDCEAKMQMTHQADVTTNQAAYMHDKIGLHRVLNPSNDVPAVSLHLYSPPIRMCQTFCEETGRARKSGNCVFFSVRGQRLDWCTAGLGECEDPGLLVKKTGDC